MKRKYGIILCGAVLMLMGCTGRKASQGVVEIVADSTEVADTTVYGICGDGCAMNTLQLITHQGDTLYCILEQEDSKSSSEVKGGMGVGDKIGAVLTQDADGQRYVQTAVNITSLMGKWSNLDKSFQLNEDGSVTSNVKEPKPYTHWRLYNGKLVLSMDTFDIVTLGPDSLYLKDARGTVGYRHL